MTPQINYLRTIPSKYLQILSWILLFTLSLQLQLQVQAQEQDDPRWVTTWSTSPSTMPQSGADEAAGARDQTLRLIVLSSIGGSSLRLRLSNYHGDGPMNIGAASVALQTQGSSIQSGSSMAVTFNGQPIVTIARGATIFSDPVDFDVPELTNLSVSLYLPGASGFLTAHALSNQTNYLTGSGNQVTSSRLTGAAETPAWSLLTAIDVIADESITAIAMVGDSITDGWGSTLSGNQRWPNHFARRLFQDESMAKFAIVNAGISGNQVTSEASPQFGQNLQARFERDVLALSKISHMVLMEGINDIGMPTMAGGESASADAIIAGYRQVLARAHARGIKVIGATLTPYEGAVYFTADGELIRQQVNDFIRNSGEFDGVIDFEKVVQDPANPSRILPSLTADNLHPNDAGYKLMAEAIDLSLFK